MPRGSCGARRRPPVLRRRGLFAIGFLHRAWRLSERSSRRRSGVEGPKSRLISPCLCRNACSYQATSRLRPGAGMTAIRILCLAFIGLAVACGGPSLAAGKPDKVSFYFAAHEDDWQLFMNPSAFQDVLDGASKTVFVHVTAGDAGLGTGQGNRKQPYYLARENGAREALRFMADTDKEPATRSESRAALNTHRVFRIAYRSTVSYFLRVPDGNIKGEGFEDTGFQSLLRLHKGAMTTMTAVDGLFVYRGWDDLVRTVRAIVDAERGAAALDAVKDM